VRIGFKTSQTDVDWPTLVATWELGDELDVATPLRERFG
jgi:hypothetical protein